MAEMQQPYQNGESEQSGRPRTVINIVGAMTSLALIAGIGVWGYKMIVRDVSGVPVIEAAAGPMRVQPDDPGGQQALNQGLSLNEIAAGGAAGEPAEQLILAPEPLDLTLEGADYAALDAAGADKSGAAAEEADAAETDADHRTEMERMAEDMAEGVAPLEELDPAGESDAADAEGQDIAAAAPDSVEGGLGRSLRPRLRPLSLGDGPEAVTRAAAQVDRARDIDPETIPADTRLAQLGAFSSRAVAEQEWDRLADRFDGYLADKDRVIQKATSGGRTFYRLRAMGFEGLKDARRFCSALVEQNAECIPVVVR